MDGTGYQQMVEPLTARELEILNLISRGCSNRDIARELVLSLGTVKWYNRQIFSKLGVHSRSKAAAHARDAGLFEDKPGLQPAPEQMPEHNLPAQVTSFIGRERESNDIKQLLRTSRLVTLTGTGGSGKTRLALWVARDILQEFNEGVYFISLAPLRDPKLVPDAISRVLDVQEVPGQTLIDTLKVRIQDKHMLLLLDNFEHLLDAAPLVSRLLSACERLKVLVTSREALHIYGEHEYNIPPLSIPEEEGYENLSKFVNYESVQLFQQRAASIKPGFAITDQDIEAVAEICIRLDGLPLAIELAAARSKLYSPQMLREHLESRLNALGRGGRDLPMRLQTLRGTLDWSYELLEVDEQALLARISVFQGGSTLEGIETICKPGLSMVLIEGLESLVDKNLVFTKEEPKGELRFFMLETIREYAYEKLELRGEIEEIKSQHADYFSDLAVQAEKEIFLANQEYWLEWLRSDYSNLRAAMLWSLGRESVTPGAKIVGALWEFWYHEGLFIEGMRWVERALAHADDIPAGINAKILNTASKMSFALGDYNAGKEYGWDGLALAKDSGDEVTRAWIMTTLCSNLYTFKEELELTVELIEKAIVLFERTGDEAGKARSYMYFGEFNRALGDYNRAKAGYEKSLNINRRIGNIREIGMAIANLSYVAMHQGEYKQAEKLARKGLEILVEFMSKYYMAIGLAMLAGPLAAQKYPERAAVLMGASNGILDALEACQQPGDQMEFDRYIKNIRAQLNVDQYEQALARGSAMSLEEALEYALEGNGDNN